MAGHLKIATIVFTAGLLAGACSGGGESEPTETSTLPAPTPTPVSTSTAEPVAPTATVRPALDTPQPVDTSDWPTFSSPLGFDMKYPAGWTVVDSGTSEFTEERVRIYNELTYRNYEERLGTLGRGYAPDLDAAWFDISPGPLLYFDVAALIGICGSAAGREDGSSRADETNVDGHRAVRCVQTGLTFGGEYQADSVALWVEEPPGSAVHIGWNVTGGDQDIIAVAEAALATITFHE